MKVIVDTTIPDLTEEEIEEEIAEMIEWTMKNADDDIEGFKKDMAGTTTVILSPQAAAQLEAMGLSTDDLVSMIMKKAGRLS